MYAVASDIERHKPRRNYHLDFPIAIWNTAPEMSHFSNRQAAKKLGIGIATLSRYIAAGKVPAPKPMKIGRNDVRGWTEDDIERVRVLLPKIANGRKTRYSKLKKEKPAPKRSKP
ncbi:MAG: hypothetical protein DMG65_09425 [Candidatus Angelobacter sp. Gp1-AA117]|nr:MAG: hypothetical protein DMG65_09425 [Candidatus Angelobacter sp. Gp1-AA117]